MLAHALPDGRAAVLHGSADDTAAGLEACAAGDGDAWLRMVRGWDRIRDPFLDALFTPFPPVRPATRLLRRWGVAGTLDFTRLALLSVRRLGEEQFGSEEARILLSGNAMHSDVSPDSAGSALFGWLLAMLGQDVGFPVPEGGAGMLATALRRRAESLGAQVRCGVAVTSVEVTGGRAVGVRLADGTTVRARHGILADVPAPTLYGRLVAARPPAAPAARRRATASSGTTPPSRSTGRSTPRSPGRRPGPAVPARCTSAWTTTGWSTSPLTSLSAGCRAPPSSSSAR